MVTWSVDSIFPGDGSASSVVNWRANGEPLTVSESGNTVDITPTVHGTIIIDGLVINADTTEQDILAKVKEALNALDSDGSRTASIENALIEQASSMTNPKVKSVKFPWQP